MSLDTILFSIEFGFVLLLVLIGYVAGQTIERRHYRSLQWRERSYAKIVTLMVRVPPPGVQAAGGQLVSGSVVIATDYFKNFVAAFWQLLGGRYGGYERLLERGRREAILRLKEDASRLGSTLVIGVRFETASIDQGIEVMAYGTALLSIDARAGQGDTAPQA